MQAVILERVSKSYRVGSVEVPALRGVDVAIRGAGITAIAGASGSGKTTLLNLIGCIDRPDAGVIRVSGIEVGRMSDDALSDFRAATLGFVFQSFNLLSVLTAYENVEYPLRLRRVPAAGRRARVLELLEAVGLAQYARHRPAQLSGGQQQRVALARALAARPNLVLADEPTANLDSRTGAAILELVRRLQREEAVTFVICSHDAQVIAAADDVLLMRDGRVESVHRAEDAGHPLPLTAQRLPPGTQLRLNARGRRVANPRTDRRLTIRIALARCRSRRDSSAWRPD